MPPTTMAGRVAECDESKQHQHAGDGHDAEQKTGQLWHVDAPTEQQHRAQARGKGGALDPGATVLVCSGASTPSAFRPLAASL